MLGVAGESGMEALEAPQEEVYEQLGRMFDITGTGEAGKVRGRDLVAPAVDKAMDYLPDSVQKYREAAKEGFGVGADIVVDPLNLTPAGVLGVPRKAMKAVKGIKNVDKALDTARATDRVADASKIPGFTKRPEPDLILDIPGQKEPLRFGKKGMSKAELQNEYQKLLAEGKLPKGSRLFDNAYGGAPRSVDTRSTRQISEAAKPSNKIGDSNLDIRELQKLMRKSGESGE